MALSLLAQEGAYHWVHVPELCGRSVNAGNISSRHGHECSLFMPLHKCWPLSRSKVPTVAFCIRAMLYSNSGTALGSTAAVGTAVECWEGCPICQCSDAMESNTASGFTSSGAWPRTN